MKKKILRSFYPKKNDLSDEWILYDAKNMVLGKAASDIASLLLGKFLPTFTKGACNQYVIVINSGDITVTGKKTVDKKYYRHSGYPGGLKEASYKQLKEKDPTDPLRIAVRGMLPKNSYGRKLQTRVFFYSGEQHKHDAQQPSVFKKG